MKLATYLHGEQEKLGLVRPDGAVVDLAAAFDAAGLGKAPDNMIRLITDVSQQDLERAAAGSDDLEAADPAQLSWLPPVPRPSKVCGVVLNNKAVASTAHFIADHPIFFTYPPSALLGHDQPVVIRPDYGLTHPEAELGVIIGARAKDLRKDEAMDAVFGYTVVNDITSVGLKSEDTVVFKQSGAGSFTKVEGDRPPPGFEHGDMQLTYHARSKGTDTFAPCGPWIVTRDEISDPNALAVQLFMGDELCTEDNTGNLTFDVPRALAHISRYMSLYPGDLIHMGTAATGKYKLREIDFQTWDGPCAVEIQQVGRLSNPIVREA